MTAAPIHFHGERLMLDPAGAAFWPARRVLIVADLHLEKASAAARQGHLLPPFDTRATLEKFSRLLRLYRPEIAVALGDSFHDRAGAERLSDADRARLGTMARSTAFIWITGNHDPAPQGLPGTSVDEWRDGPFVLRHQAAARLGPHEVEISGHYHPKASIETKAKTVCRPCFVTDSARLMLPAFGAYTGGLDVRDPAITRLFPRGLRVFLLGEARLFSFSLGQLGRMPEPA
jgi:DNA ligase-associated metallophosphoesterase